MPTFDVGRTFTNIKTTMVAACAVAVVGAGRLPLNAQAHAASRNPVIRAPERRALDESAVSVPGQTWCSKFGMEWLCIRPIGTVSPW